MFMYSRYTLWFWFADLLNFALDFQFGSAMSAQFRAARKSTVIAAENVHELKCCWRKCLSNVPVEVVNVLRDAKRVFAGNANAKFLLNYLQQHEAFDERGAFLFLIGAKIVCQTAFCFAHGIPESTFYRVKCNYLSGQKNFIHGNSGVRNQNSAVHSGWMFSFYNSTHREIHHSFTYRFVHALFLSSKDTFHSIE